MRQCLLIAVLILLPCLARAEEPAQPADVAVAPPSAPPAPPEEEENAPPPELEGVASPEDAPAEADGADGMVAAVQERMYQLKHELTLGVGLLPFDAFTRGVAAQVGYTYHFGDHFAWQVGRGFFNFSFNTGLKEQLEKRYGVSQDEFDRADWAVGSDLIWSPLYGKSSLMNRTLIWFQVYLLAGSSVFKLLSGFSPAANVGAGFRVFAGQNLSVRLEAVNHFLFPRRFQSILNVQLAVGLNFGGTPSPGG